MTHHRQPVTTTEIADLLAWARALTQTRADPAQKATYQAAKADLLARIAAEHPDDEPAHQAAAHTRTAALTTDTNPEDIR
jgi:hypothetical protein